MDRNPKFEFEPEQPVLVTLMQDTPKTGHNAKGDWWLWNVKISGSDFSFFAPPEVAEFIINNKLKKGDQFQVCQTYDGLGIEDYRMEIKIKHTGNGNGNGTVKDEYYQTMKESLRQAIQIQQELGSVIDVNRIGLSLFIQKTKI